MAHRPVMAKKLFRVPSMRLFVESQRRLPHLPPINLEAQTTVVCVGSSISNTFELLRYRSPVAPLPVLPPLPITAALADADTLHIAIVHLAIHPRHSYLSRRRTRALRHDLVIALPMSAPLIGAILIRNHHEVTLRS